MDVFSFSEREEHLFRVFWENPFTALVLLDHGRILQVNEAFASLLGVPCIALRGKMFWDLLFSEDVSFVQAHLSSSDGNTLRYRLRTDSNAEIAIESCCKPLLFESCFCQLLFLKAQSSIQLGASHFISKPQNTLASFPNRFLLANLIEGILSRTKRDPSYFAVLLIIQLKDIELIHANIGPSKSDQFLYYVGRGLRKFFSESVLVSYFDNNAFAVLLDDLQEESKIESRLSSLKEAFATPIVIDEHEIFVSFSVGIASSSRRYQHPDEMLRDAIRALHQAKQERIDNQFFRTSLGNQLTRSMLLKNGLQRALKQQEFALHYQPIYQTEQGTENYRLLGFEALLRWNHSYYGWIPPCEFIPMAEESGAIVPIGEWIIYEACRQMKEWHDTFPHLSYLSMSVNLSYRQFQNNDLIASISRILQLTQFPAWALKLELTESVFIEQAERIEFSLKQLRFDGIGIYLDDFGTGYSSFSYLHRLPLDAIKLDRSFISTLHTDEKKQTIVKSTLELADKLGFFVVAEGVEEYTHLQLLARMGCRVFQGFFFSKPLPSSDAFALLKIEENNIM